MKTRVIKFPTPNDQSQIQALDVAKYNVLLITAFTMLLIHINIKGKDVVLLVFFILFYFIFSLTGCHCRNFQKKKKLRTCCLRHSTKFSTMA